jgi:hypothetical protein
MTAHNLFIKARADREPRVSISSRKRVNIAYIYNLKVDRARHHINHRDITWRHLWTNGQDTHHHKSHGANRFLQNTRQLLDGLASLLKTSHLAKRVNALFNPAA